MICPICNQEAQLTEETSFQEEWVGGKRRFVEGRYRHCDQCGVEYADEEDINFNAQKMREIRDD